MARPNSIHTYDIEGSEWRQAEKSSSLFFLLILFALVALDYQLKELLKNYLKKQFRPLTLVFSPATTNSKLLIPITTNELLTKSKE